jgi:hypothetical protein
LAECSRDAALAYPWIFLVADDHGRFEYKPRAVWKNAFAYRQDVTVEDVARWMDEYWKVGLLSRYHIQGELAHWYKFRGRKPSDRRPSEYPDPKEIPTFEYPSATTPPRRGDDTATPPRQTRARDRAEQSRDRAERNGSAGDSAPVAVVPSKPRATWLTTPGELWRSRWGSESEPPWGEMGKAFEKPHAEFGARGQLGDLWERWGRFLAAAETSQWARPWRFVQGLGEWVAGSRVRAGPSTVADRAVEQARAAVEARKAREAK